MKTKLHFKQIFSKNALLMLSLFLSSTFAFAQAHSFEFTDATGDGFAAVTADGVMTATGDGFLNVEMINARESSSGLVPYWRANIKTLTPLAINAATHPIVLVRFINPPTKTSKLSIKFRDGATGTTYETLKKTNVDITALFTGPITGTSDVYSFDMSTMAGISPTTITTNYFQIRFVQSFNYAEDEAGFVPYGSTPDSHPELKFQIDYIKIITKADYNKTLAVASNKLESEFKIYPNPSTNNAFNLNLGNSFSKSSANIKVFNILGELFVNKDYSLDSSKSVHVSHELASGIYFVKVDNTSVRKLIVK
jgi:hypothetical protein